jgi:hypothetical protein
MKMELIVQIVVVLVVVGFITELFFFGGFSPGGNKNAPKAGQNITGVASFTGTIRTYDPLLALPTNTDKALLDQVKNRPEVTAVTQQGNFIIVRTETRDDVFPLAAYLRSRNVSSIAIANIALPPDLQVNTGTAIMNITTMGAIVRVDTEPFLDVDSQVEINMTAIASSDLILIDYQNVQILAKSVKLPLNATISRLTHSTYIYTIPWEDRITVLLSLSANSSEYSYSFKANDNLLFSTPITIDQIKAKKLLAYVSYVDSNSATVVPGFDNRTQVEQNFQDTSVTFPVSYLSIIVNPGNYIPDLPYNSSVTYSYSVGLPSSISGYTLPNESIVLETTMPHDAGDVVETNVSGIAIGTKIFSPVLS